ncbi:response regulator [candidate division KSB1 bacterium]|nr:response regulator [candidate division KSB1 bacterium]RQW00159.1 MAG: response regulator [candidate division KSB1 bacterium]
MDRPNQTLQQLVSPEILFEIQTSFLKKYGVAVCIFDDSIHPQLTFPDSIPALDKLPAEQKNQFKLFFDPAFLDIISSSVNRQHIVQSFGDDSLRRAIYPIFFAEELKGWVVVLQFVKQFEPDRDEHFLEALSRVAQKRSPMNFIQDSSVTTSTNDINLYSRELLNVVQLFLEAGLARAQISPEQPDDENEKNGVAKSKIGILFCASNGNIVDSILHVAEFLGYRISDFSDLNFFRDLLATDYDREKIRVLLQEGTTSKTSAALIARDGSHMTADIQLIIQRTKAGIIGFECHLSTEDREALALEELDTTAPEQYLSYDEQRIMGLRNIYAPLQQQLAALVNPLVSYLAQFFDADTGNVRIKKRLAEIRALSNSLSTFANQLRFYTQKKLPDMTQTNLNELVKNIARKIERLLPEEIALEVNLGQLVETVALNPEHIVHAVGCLCKNAVEAMPDGGLLSLETHMSPARNNQEMVTISIKDTGMGFPNAVQDRLFEPFVSTKSTVGAGLGLSAAYGIVKSHGGHLCIKSRHAEGTTVFIYLPIVQAGNQTVQEDKPSETSVKGHILLVDDEQNLAEATAMALRREGYAVFTSNTCEDALAIYNKIGDKIDLIILDNQLVGASGKKCAQDLIKKSPRISILFYSGADDDLELMAFIRSIGAGWLKKPFATQELLARVNSLLSRNKV